MQFIDSRDFSCNKNKKKMARNPNNKTHFTLIEQKPAVRAAVLKGIKYGLSYQSIADSVGVRPETLGIWLKKCRQVEQEFKDLGLDEEQIAYLSSLNAQLENRRQELDKEWGRNVISLAIKHKYFLKLAQDLKGAEAKAEARMLGVIRKAAIGHQTVTETKRKSIMIKDPDGGDRLLPAEEITEVTKELRPQWQAAAWFLERRYPEKYAQKKIIQGELPPDIPYEVFVTAKTLLQLPKVELDRIIAALRARVAQPKVANAPAAAAMLPEKSSGVVGESCSK